MKFAKVLTPASESGGSESDEDVRAAVDGPTCNGGVGEGVSWDARCLNMFRHLSRMDCNLGEGFVDMVEEAIGSCARSPLCRRSS